MRQSNLSSSAARLRGRGRIAATVAAEGQTPAFARSADASLRPLEEAQRQGGAQQKLERASGFVLWRNFWSLGGFDSYSKRRVSDF